ncbi:MAG: arginine--tRNA ligase [Thermoplasmata archaeon]|nr:arginine--tRNA ligase [Thermoplasmata archaeon]
MPGDASRDAGAGFDPWAPVIDSVVDTLAASLRKRGLAWEPPAVRALVDEQGSEYADLAIPLHKVSALLRQPAASLASELVVELGGLSGLLPPVAAGPYLNLSADPQWLVRVTLDQIAERKGAYGHRSALSEAVCVEHTSANPTGPFHIGRVRNGIIGDTLARVLRAAGHPVTTQYYVDDVGRQAAMITWIWSKPATEWPPEIRATVPETPEAGEKPDLRLGRPYPAVSAYLKEHAEAREEVALLTKRLERGEGGPGHRQFAEEILGGMTESLARIGIRFDEFVWESGFVRDGSVEKVVERLRRAPHAVQEENGAWAIDTSGYGLPKETARVIVTRADGTTLYPTRDVAYHLSKFARFPRVIDVLGQDHQLHARTLDALLAEMGESRRPEFVIYQDITVPEGGRMSTRKGSAVYLDALLDEAVERARKEVLARREDLAVGEVEEIATKVACSAVRYHILRVASEKTVGFRWEDALSFEGRSGPFLQYAYSRASSILRKAERTTGPYPFDPELLQHPQELALVRSLSKLPSTVAYVARTSHVHTLAGYAHGLAERFNRFYQFVPVLKAGQEREGRLALVAASRQVLANCFELLGIDPLERM